MTTKQIDFLNIGLIFIAILIAFKLPFELFLFSYAVLGPLHYLTEISWLKKQKYYTTGTKDYLVLGGIAALYVLLTLLFDFSKHENLAPYFQSIFGEDLIPFRSAIGSITIALMFSAFVGAIVMAFVQKTTFKWLAVLGAFGLGLVLDGLRPYNLLFSTLVPTLVHVFIFTGAFMIYGALKGKNRTGMVTFGIFLLAGMVCLFSSFFDPDYRLSDQTLSAYLSTQFQYLNYEMMKLLGTAADGTIRDNYPIIFNSVDGMGIARFIAFAYTYHYLNWFSKTSIIKWHQVPKNRLVMVGVIWLISVGLYYYNYRVGLMALLFLSVLHVVLEFPLNFKSFQGIGQALSRKKVT